MQNGLKLKDGLKNAAAQQDFKGVNYDNKQYYRCNAFAFHHLPDDTVGIPAKRKLPALEGA